MNRIALILPYMGSFPNYFSLWAMSAKKNDFIDFYVITDQVKNRCNDENIYYIPMAFNELKFNIQKIFDFPIALDEAYKICDYRPVFGKVFADILASYEFWGHCDPDVIWGKLKNFITEEILNDYDKIYSCGHLTIYRNNEFINNLYAKSICFNMLNYRDAFQTNYPCHFDESEGMTYICKKTNVKTYEKIDYADINYRNYAFARAVSDESKFFIYKWINGELFECSYSDEQKNIQDKRCAYIHLQKRKMNIFLDIEQGATEKFLIVPNAFLPMSDDNIISKAIFIKHTTDKKFYSDYYISRMKNIKFKLKNGYIKYKLVRAARKLIKGVNI
ncbi:DUF6625 family protein [Klebsiella sp. RIT-PI-d]|uniref:DUF6625 family protein n=1 Tax=Klebsiella sp. RIT-PI-d TaxID=1681196 RepID=UPI000AFB0331|nr:DUF6625 family protein [Klebsiella sp. RIT-PI-d]